MKDEIKQARLAALLGLTEHIPVPKTPLEKEREVAISREIESVISYLHEPKGFVQVDCKLCHRTFAVNRGNISLCSDHCRVSYLSEVFGIDVDYTARTPEDRWSQSTGGREPLIVPPIALAILLPDLQLKTG